MARFNEWLALRVTGAVGTMWCAYVFVGLACVSLPAVLHTGDPVVIVSWVAQTFFQLVLLPVILVGQSLQAKRAEDRHAEVTQHLHEQRHHLRLIHAKVED